MNPELQTRVRMLLAALPSAWVASAFRSYAEQTRLYNGWKAGLPGFAPANYPGTSMHEKGLAVDVDCAPGDNGKRASFIKQFGLYTPHSGEPWHMELDPKRSPLDQPGASMPKQVMSCLVPSKFGYVGHWVLTADGGVRAIGGAPFYGSYPGLPPESRQGKRSFTSIQATARGYIIFGDDDSYYEFEPK